MSYPQTISYIDDTANTGVTFPFTMLNVQAQAVFAEDGIQQEGLRYTFQVRGTIVADTPLDLNNQIVTMLNYCGTEGLHFTVQWGDPNDLDSAATFDFNDGDDDRWGPIPGPLTFDRFGGGVAANYSWSVTVVTKQCFGPDCSINPPVNNAVLSLTTRYSSEIDMSGLTTLTVAGQLRISSFDVENNGVTADSFCSKIMMPVPQNFQQVSWNKQSSSDGTLLNWSQQLKEMVYTLPDPITAGEADFSVSLQQTGMLANVSLTGWFEGTRMTTKTQLFSCINDLINAKLGFWIANPANLITFTQREFTQSQMYGRNRLSFSVQGIVSVGVAAGGGLDVSAIAPALLTGPPNSTGTAHYITPFGGDSKFQSGAPNNLPMFNNDACDSDLSWNQELQNPGTIPVPPGGGNGAPSDPSGAAENTASPSHLATPYLTYHETISWDVDNGLLVLYPKVAGSKPISQQVRNPRLLIIQAGYLTKIAPSANVSTMSGLVPPPIISVSSTKAALLSASIQPSSPEPIGDGTNSQWTIHWRYTMESLAGLGGTSGATTFSPEVVWPKDPRRAGATATSGAVTGLPQIVNDLDGTQTNSSPGAGGLTVPP